MISEYTNERAMEAESDDDDNKDDASAHDDTFSDNNTVNITVDDTIKGTLVQYNETISMQG